PLGPSMVQRRLMRPCPFIKFLHPADGPKEGGNVVRIVGANLDGTTAVTFGSVPATSFRVVNNDEVEAIAPPGKGTVPVTVTARGRTSDPAFYRYICRSCQRTK